MCLTGVATDYCVRSTALDALSLGFGVEVCTDAVAAVDPEAGERALHELAGAGAVLCTSAQLLARPPEGGPSEHRGGEGAGSCGAAAAAAEHAP